MQLVVLNAAAHWVIGLSNPGLPSAFYQVSLTLYWWLSLASCLRTQHIELARTQAKSMLGPKSRVLTTSAQSFKGADNALLQVNDFPADKCSNTCSTIHQREIYHEDNTICPSSNQNQVTISSRNATFSCVKQKCIGFLPIMVTFIKIIKADCLDGSYSIPVFSSCLVGGQHCSYLVSLPEIF